MVILGVGFTVMVKICEAPVQPFAVGVTVKVAVTGVVPVLTAVNDPMLPLPEAGSPMELLLFVQLNVVLLTAPVKLMAVVGLPLHIAWLPGLTTVGVGLTVTVKFMGVPVHPLAVGVTVTVVVTGVVPVFDAVKTGIFPEPLVPKPTLLVDVHA